MLANYIRCHLFLRSHLDQPEFEIVIVSDWNCG